MHRIFQGLLCTAFALALQGCSEKGRMSNDRLATSWLEAMNRHDTTALALFYADSAKC